MTVILVFAIYLCFSLSVSMYFGFILVQSPSFVVSLFVVSLLLSAFRYQSSVFIVPSSSSQSFVGHSWEGLASKFLLFEFPSAFRYQSFVFLSSSSVVRQPRKGQPPSFIICPPFVISLPYQLFRLRYPPSSPHDPWEGLASKF